MPRNVIGLAAYLSFLVVPATFAAGDAVEATAEEVAVGTVIEGTIVAVAFDFGNLQTDIPASAMTIDLDDPFTFSCKGASFPATWVSSYEDVAEGEWLGLSGQGDQVQIAVSFGNADETSGCGVGDTVGLKLTALTE
jgi:S-adenosylmethionine hydrolase